MRSSDRWVTPAVVVVGLVCATVVVLGCAACVTYLTQRGVDPDPMLKLVGQIVAAVTGPASLVLQLANRRSVTKTERNTGVLANAVYDVADALPRPVARHAANPPTVAMTSAPPAPRGS